MIGSVYLLHLDLPGPARRVTHYLGYADGDVDRHLEQYRRGGGPPLVRAAIAAGAQVMLVRTWSEGERDGGCLRRSHAGQLCPLCARGRRRAGVASSVRQAEGRARAIGGENRRESSLQVVSLLSRRAESNERGVR